MTATFSSGPILYLLLEPAGASPGALESRGAPPHSRVDSARRLSDHERRRAGRRTCRLARNLGPCQDHVDPPLAFSAPGLTPEATLLPRTSAAQGAARRELVRDMHPQHPRRPRSSTPWMHWTAHPVPPR